MNDRELRKEQMRSFFTAPVIASGVILLLILVCSVLAPLLAPYDPNAVDLPNTLSPPSPAHWLGTDATGRDMLSRLLFGSRTTILSAVCIVAISAVIGIPLGLLSGFFGRWADKIISRACDVLLSFPSLLLAFVLVAVFGRGITTVVIALGILYVPMLTKLTRSMTLVEENKVYVEAATSIGFSSGHIMLKEILPNILSTLVVQMMLDIGYAVLDLSAMSFLGLGVTPPTADWGAMLEEGRILIAAYPALALAPGLMIVVTVVAVNVFGDGINAFLNPSQRKLPSRRRFLRMVWRQESLERIPL
ncbi:MAG: ABC transporter permease [Clostridiales bacterium]|nr:ABC transporter permease [Clostridiales bacterium]